VAVKLFALRHAVLLPSPGSGPAGGQMPPPIDYPIPDFAALYEGAEKARQQAERARILKALGLPEDADLNALLAAATGAKK
jgi:hypothetical protein